MRKNMKSWKMILHLNHDKGMMASRPTEIKSSIYQAPSWTIVVKGTTTPMERSATSSTWMTWRPLREKWWHANRPAENHQIDDIGMEIGLDKCAKATVKRRRLADSSNTELYVNTVIQDLEQEGTYQYLEISKGDGIQHSQMKEKIRKEYYRRFLMVLKSELNSANKFKAIKTLAASVVTYSFNIIN